MKAVTTGFSTSAAVTSIFSSLMLDVDRNLLHFLVPSAVPTATVVFEAVPRLRIGLKVMAVTAVIEIVSVVFFSSIASDAWDGILIVKKGTVYLNNQ